MKILAIRDPHRPSFFDIITEHVRAQKDIELQTRTLLDPVSLTKDDGYDLVVFWLLDPLINRAGLMARASWLAQRCEELGIPVFQKPQALAHGRKSTFSKLLRDAGVKGVQVPDARSLVSHDAVLKLLDDKTMWPLFVREDDLHASDMIRIDAPHHSALLRAVGKFQRPVAIKYIETGRAGVYRKYRCVFAGDRVVPLHLQMGPHWVVRGEHRLFTNEAIMEEQAFIGLGWDEDYENYGEDSPYGRCARVLGLDFGAFDASLDPETGEVVLWEVNPAPVLHFINRYKDMDDGRRLDLEYRNDATRLVLDTIVGAYRTRAQR